MAGELLVVAGLPSGVADVFGLATLTRLAHAHPRVRVEIVHDAARFEAILPEADGAIVWPGFATISGSALAPHRRLRWIQSIPAGVDSLLTPEIVAADHVVITSSKGPLGPLMAEHAAMLMLALARDLPGYLQDQAKHRWRTLTEARPMAQLFGKTIAVLGVGAVGGNLARLCKVGFGMRVLGFSRTRLDSPHVDRYFARGELHDALGESDVVALCLALTPQTERIVDAAAIAAMKPGAYLVNVARGGLVDEDALVTALREGRIAGAGLDAFVTEPLPASSPLWDMPNVIITPHVAPARDRLGEHGVDFWCENIRRFAEGQPLLGIVDRREGY